MCIFRWKIILWISSLMISTILSGFLFLINGFYKNYRKIPSDHLIGNKDSAKNMLKERGFPYSFLIMGDTRSTEISEKLSEKTFRDDPPSFVVLVGDFVKNPDVWNHRFFLTEMTREIRPSFPVFLVPGNHDIDYDNTNITNIRENSRKVTPEVYDSLYGARHFDFVFNNCLFILCELDPRSPTGYLSYLRQTLADKGEGRLYRFVFIHYPPKRLSHLMIGLPGEEEFFQILETFRVNACFFGDYHGYFRGQRNGVNLIVIGGGGGRFKDTQSDWGKFHHVMRVTVDREMISEEIMTIEKRLGLFNSLEEWSFVRLFPIIENMEWVLYTLTTLFISLGIYSIFWLILNLKRRGG